ncbi:MAG: DUF1491 family protein [Pseudomonadota bacterium]
MHLKRQIWVGAYRARLEAEGVFVTVLHRGDETAGDVQIKVAFMDGRASLYARRLGVDGLGAWEEELVGVAEGEVDATLDRRRARDRDLWVLVIEDPRGRHMLGAPGIVDTYDVGGPGWTEGD